MSFNSLHLKETVDLQYMLNRLSEDELDIAARTNYNYATSKDPSQEARHKCAEEMAARYLRSKSDRDKALAKMKATIKFRKDIDIDKLRNSSTDPISDYHLPLRKFLSNKKLYVSGYDKQGRSTYVFVPHLVDDHDPEWTRKGHVWSLERAIACSKSDDKTVNCVVDFRQFSVLRNAPPTSVGKDIMTTLRDHYVGRVNQIFLVNAPTTFLCVWAIFKPFAGKKTRDKIHFVNSNRKKEQVIGRWYSNDQAPSWMLPTGRKNRELDLDEYLQDTPFNKAFDE